MQKKADIISVPIEYAIGSSCYYRCQTGDTPPIDFKIRFISLEPLDLSQILNPSEISRSYNLKEGFFMLLKTELTSFYKEVIDTRRIIEDLLIVDQDGFQFNVSHDSYMCGYANKEFSERIGLDAFYGGEFRPKIKCTGILPFFLPKEDDAEYSFAVNKGSIQEL
ncbi:MAG: hypothetical protein JZU65_02580 [Chlorobium sp.]|nr:hypothetical protein [Chlorobium sp.]